MTNENQALYNKHKDILSLRELAGSTIKGYLSYLCVFINWFEMNLPGRSISSVTWEEVRSYVSYLKITKGNRTVNVHIAQLRDFFRYVLHRDWDKYEVPFLHFDEKTPLIPTKEQMFHIIDTIPNIRLKAEIALLYSSGMRISELVNLRCGDIYVSKNVIFISKAKNRSERYAILSKKALEILTEYSHAKKDDWLF